MSAAHEVLNELLDLSDIHAIAVFLIKLVDQRIQPSASHLRDFQQSGLHLSIGLRLELGVVHHRQHRRRLAQLFLEHGTQPIPLTSLVRPGRVQQRQRAGATGLFPQVSELNAYHWQIRHAGVLVEREVDVQQGRQAHQIVDALERLEDRRSPLADFRQHPSFSHVEGQFVQIGVTTVLDALDRGGSIQLTLQLTAQRIQRPTMRQAQHRILLPRHMPDERRNGRHRRVPIGQHLGAHDRVDRGGLARLHRAHHGQHHVQLFELRRLALQHLDGGIGGDLIEGLL